MVTTYIITSYGVKYFVVKVPPFRSKLEFNKKKEKNMDPITEHLKSILTSFLDATYCLMGSAQLFV